MPRPEPGEDKEAYVSRFMSSDEARRDYPDEKQRAAVAYSMFGEKKNADRAVYTVIDSPHNRKACPDLIGVSYDNDWDCPCKEAAMRKETLRERKNNMEICSSCGAETKVDPKALVNDCSCCGFRMLGRPTPPTEDLDNLCRTCRHPLEPEHDQFGCHVPDCGCTVTAAVIEEPRDVLPNAGEKTNAAQLCGACITAAKGKIDGKDSVEKGGKLHIVTRADGGHIEVACGADVCDCENTNALVHWNADPAWMECPKGNGQKCQLIEEPGGDDAKGYWFKCDRCGRRISIPGRENANAAEPAIDPSDYNPDGGCKKCGWGAPGTGHTSGFHKAECKILAKERARYEHLQGAERRNAVARFERPCQECGGSAYVEDAGGNDVKCSKCKGTGVETAAQMKNASGHNYVIDRDGHGFGQVTEAEAPNESALRSKLVSKGAMTAEEAKSAKFFVSDKGVGFEFTGGGFVHLRCYCDECYNSLSNAGGFAKGDRIKSDVDAQGMKRGEAGTIVDVQTDSTPFGGFTTYSVKLDSGATVSVRNGHLVLSRAENSNADDKGPYDQPNALGCNGCDDIKAPLNRFGYCQRCASKQGPIQNADGWKNGTVEHGGKRYKYQARVFDEGSQYGIDGGKVSKLFVTPADSDWSQTVIEYDRGWSRQPGSEHKPILDKLLQLFNARPDFEKTIAAFEAHCKSCATCGPVRNAPAGAPEADAKNLCPDGARLLVADLENGYSPDQMKAEAARLMFTDAAQAGGRNMYAVGEDLRAKFHGATDAEVSKAIRDAYDERQNATPEHQPHPGTSRQPEKFGGPKVLSCDKHGRLGIADMNKVRPGDACPSGDGGKISYVDLKNADRGNCEYCKGKGKVPSDENPMADEECPRCHGTGNVEAENANGPDCPCGYEFSGVAREEKCPHCGKPNPSPKPIDDVVQNADDELLKKNREAHKRELAEHEKTLEMATKSGDNDQIAKAQALVDGAKQKIAAADAKLGEKQNAEVPAKGGDEAGKPGGTVTIVNSSNCAACEKAAGRPLDQVESADIFTLNHTYHLISKRGADGMLEAPCGARLFSGENTNAAPVLSHHREAAGQARYGGGNR